MIFQDLSCVPDQTMQEWADKDIFQMLNAYGGVMFSISNRMRGAVNGAYDGAAFGHKHYQQICYAHIEEIYEVTTCKTVSWGQEQAMILHTTSRENFRVFTIIFRRGTPFREEDGVWGYKFMQLYYEKVLVANELFQDKEYIRNVFSSIDVAILTFDLNQRLVACNEFAMNLFSITVEHEFKHSREKQNEQFFSELRKVATAGNRLRIDYLPFSFQEERLLLSATFSPMRNAKGVIVGVVVVCSDVTERRLDEYQMDQLRQYALLGEVAAGLAHDVKNPLMAMRGCTKLLSSDNITKRNRDSAISIVNHELERIDAVINQTLSFCSMDGKKGAKWIQFNDALDEFISVCNRQTFGQSITFVKKFDPQMPLLLARPFAVQQAFLNPMINAVQAIGRNGEIIVESKFLSQEEKAVFEIRDNGCGMSKETLENIFTPCFTTKKKGSGMGLFVAKNVIHRYGGTIQITSEQGTGTNVTIILPVTAGKGHGSEQNSIGR